MGILQTSAKLELINSMINGGKIYKRKELNAIKNNLEKELFDIKQGNLKSFENSKAKDKKREEVKKILERINQEEKEHQLKLEL